MEYPIKCQECDAEDLEDDGLIDFDYHSGLFTMLFYCRACNFEHEVQAQVTDIGSTLKRR